jgi:hypothetical protein
MRITATIAIVTAVATGSAVLMPTSGNTAPMSDAAYCATLINTYQKYIVETRDPDTKGPMRADLDAAVARCQAGDATGIPPLEKALRDARFNLPARE